MSLPLAERRRIRNAAADLLEQRGWCRFTEARNKKGPCSPLSRSAREFCAAGALRRAAKNANLVGADVGIAVGWLSQWNDHKATKEQVIAFLRSDLDTPEQD